MKFHLFSLFTRNVFTTVESMFSLTKEKWSPRNKLGDALKEHLLFSVLYKERLKLGFMRHFGKVNVRKELTFGSCGKLWQTQPSTPTAS